MAYFVHISDQDRSYLDSLPISDEGKERVADFIDYAIARVTDEFRNDPANRPWPADPYFVRDFILLEEDELGNRTWHKMYFIVNDKAAAAGVLIIVFVDHLLA